MPNIKALAYSPPLGDAVIVALILIIIMTIIMNTTLIIALINTFIVVVMAVPGLLGDPRKIVFILFPLFVSITNPQPMGKEGGGVV